MGVKPGQYNSGKKAGSGNEDEVFEESGGTDEAR